VRRGLRQLELRALHPELQLPSCGDDFIQADEECDDGPHNGPSSACLDICVKATCGDGRVFLGVEECDDGNDVDDDACDRQCRSR